VVGAWCRTIGYYVVGKASAEGLKTSTRAVMYSWVSRETTVRPWCCAVVAIIKSGWEKVWPALRPSSIRRLRFGRLFLVGDAAHIVPPTSAKGLNLAASDVRFLYQALVEFYRTGSEALIAEYSARALARVWKATRFSWWFTTLMHKFSDDSFGHKLQLAELEYLEGSAAGSKSFAENYVGLPY
jgi:p-hydroxybenzoate 3-monooxygenase